MSDFEKNENRPQVIEDFLKKNKYHLHERHRLSGDASHKKITRLLKNKKTVIFLDANPLLGENPLAIAATTELLVNHNINVPKILAADTKNGFFILEDLGDCHLRTYLETNDKEKETYQEAVKILHAVHSIPVNDVLQYNDQTYTVHDYSTNKLISEARIFLDWYFSKVMGRKIPSIAYDEFVSILKGLLTPISENNSVYTLFDYHADNIMIPEEQENTLYLIDFQDLSIGHPAYDLVSLLQDIRRTVSKNTQETLIEEYLHHNPTLCPEAFKRAYLILGTQRAIKILGIFARFWVRDHKDNYLSYIPYTWQVLEDNLSCPELYPLKEWFDHWVPVTMRKLDYLSGV